ncbi:MAG TPA: hypothetical protein VKA27_16445 [Sunxiuqinia sp.]|nr:hypothetical protein [Sunxiuqinia sp.]
MEIKPLPANARVYFDDEAAKVAATKASEESVSLVPEYSIDLKIVDGVLKRED